MNISKSKKSRQVTTPSPNGIPNQSTSPKSSFQSLKNILISKDFLEQRAKSTKYVTREFQDFGYRLALQLGDLSRVSMYMRLAKRERRELLVYALSFAKDYPKAKNKASIFMWKLKELRKELKEKQKEKGNEQIGLL